MKVSLFTKLTLKWFGVWCDKLQAVARWNRGQECVWDEGRNSQQFNQLGYGEALATPKNVGGRQESFCYLLSKESLSGQIYLCEEGSISGGFIKRKENTFLWKKKNL